MNVREMLNLYEYSLNAEQHPNFDKEEEIIESPKNSRNGIEICIILDTSPGIIELEANRKIFSSIEKFLNEQKTFNDDSCFLFVTTNGYEIRKHRKQEISNIKEIKKDFLYLPLSGALIMDSIEKAFDSCNNYNSVVIIVSHSDDDPSLNKDKEKEIISKIKKAQKRNDMMFIVVYDGKMCQKWAKNLE